MLEITGWPKGRKNSPTAYSETVMPGQSLEVVADLPIGLDDDGFKHCRINVKCALGTTFFISEIDPMKAQAEAKLSQFVLTEAEHEVSRLRQELEAAHNEVSRLREVLGTIADFAQENIHKDEDKSPVFCEHSGYCGCENPFDCSSQDEEPTAPYLNGVCAYPDCECRPEQWCPSPDVNFHRAGPYIIFNEY